MVLIMDVTRALLDKVLKGDARTPPDQPNRLGSEIEVEALAPRR
jgi:hypothetical protein